ncbi:MAG: terminus macrodomain insulation protein YfbV [Aeromonas sp.]
MSMNIVRTKLQQGRHYMSLWPCRPELNPMFPENRVIKATEFAIKVIPALAVLSVMLQFQFGALHYWPSTITTVLFLLSLPLQGYYWLGQRANTPLPPSLANWYREINGKMNEQGGRRQLVPHPRYEELAETLKAAFKQLDKSFLYE